VVSVNLINLVLLYTLKLLYKVTLDTEKLALVERLAASIITQ